MLKSNDALLTGILGGLAGVLSIDLPNYILWKRKKIKHLFAHVACSMLMKPRKARKAKNLLLGESVHIVTGSTLGVILMMIFKKFGKEHHLIKGAFFGMAVWVTLYSFGQRTNLFQIKPRKTKGHYSGLIHHLVFGTTTAHAIVSLAGPKLLNSGQTSTGRTGSN